MRLIGRKLEVFRIWHNFSSIKAVIPKNPNYNEKDIPIVISPPRLFFTPNIVDGTWKPYSEGKMTDYIYDQNGNYTIKLVTENSTVESRNIARLAAGLGFNR